jgi:hypothetical protein
MANNRMVLVCNVCHPKKNKWKYGDKGVLVIAKWYPGGAYYRNDDGTGMGNEFLKFLEEHNHPEFDSQFYSKGSGQENPIRLEYESESLPIIKKK